MQPRDSVFDALLVHFSVRVSRNLAASLFGDAGAAHGAKDPLRQADVQRQHTFAVIDRDDYSVAGQRESYRDGLGKALEALYSAHRSGVGVSNHQR